MAKFSFGIPGGSPSTVGFRFGEGEGRRNIVSESEPEETPEEDLDDTSRGFSFGWRRQKKSVVNDDGTLNPEEATRSPDEAQAAITRKQFEEVENTFQPIERELAQRVGQDGEVEAQRAGEIAGKASDNAAAGFRRDIARRGIHLTDAEQTAVARRRNLQRSLDVATGKNVTRRNVKERNTNLKGELVGIGRGVARGATDALGAAGDLASARKEAGRRMRDARGNPVLNAASGAAAGFMAGGPAGAAIGGGLGLLQGLL